MDFQGMRGDLPRNAWHIRGFPRKDVFVAAEEVDERAFLFEGKCGTNTYHFALGAAGIHEDFLDPSADSNDPIDFLALGASSATSSLRAVSSSEATIAVAWQQHSTSH